MSLNHNTSAGGACRRARRRRVVRRLPRSDELALQDALDLPDDDLADLSEALATMRRRSPSRPHPPLP